MSAPIVIPPDHVEAIRAAEAMAKVAIADNVLALGLGVGFLNEARTPAIAAAMRALGIDPDDAANKYAVDFASMTLTKIAG